MKRSIPVLIILLTFAAAYTNMPVLHAKDAEKLGAQQEESGNFKKALKGK